MDPNNAPFSSHFEKRELDGESMKRSVKVVRMSVGRRRIGKWRQGLKGGRKGVPKDHEGKESTGVCVEVPRENQL